METPSDAFLNLTSSHGSIAFQISDHQVPGGNVGWVIARFPAELHACRQRHKRSKTLLIVMVDADDKAVAERHQQLLNAVDTAKLDPCEMNDPVVILTPKRQVETWIRNALGEDVNELQDCKVRKAPDKSDCRRAAKAIYDGARANASYPDHFVPSLVAAFPTWRRIC